MLCPHRQGGVELVQTGRVNFEFSTLARMDVCSKSI